MVNLLMKEEKRFIIIPAPDAPLIWGLAPQVRLEKQLARIGAPESGGFVILRGDVIYDDVVLQGLLAAPDTLLEQDGGERLAAYVGPSQKESALGWLTGKGEAPEGLKKAAPVQIGGAYNLMLRKREAAQAYIARPDNAREIEWALYKTSYKGVTDLVTKYLWPVPAFHATRLCARLGLSPNMVTGIGAVLMFAALFLFAEGHYGWGLLAGWIMTFLDTVDGKLARVTLSSSKWGNIFDHGIDLLHPPFWYIAWGLGLDNAGLAVPGWLEGCLWMMFMTYVLGRLCEGYFMRRFGFHIHVWRRFDSLFRLIVARRNPNMIFLTLSLAFVRPDLGLLAVVIWTALSVPAHLVQIAQAEINRAAGRPVTSWLSA